MALCINVMVFFKLLIGGGGGLISYGLKLVTSKGLFVAYMLEVLSMKMAATGILLLTATAGCARVSFEVGSLGRLCFSWAFGPAIT